jgi:hypothetical protein
MNLRRFAFTMPLLIMVLIFNSCKENTTDPPDTSSKMTLVYTFNTPGYAQDVTIYQHGINYAFVADDNAGLQVINVSNPSVPVQTGTYNTTGSATNVKVAAVGGRVYAFVADGSAGLSIIEVTSPNQPVLDTVITFVSDNVLCSFVEISTNRLYIGTYYKMYIFDISNLPGSVTQISNYNVVDNLNSIYVDGGVAYLAENTAGIELVNITNPNIPAYISSYSPPDLSMDIKVSGNYAYLANWSSMRIINVTNPFNPIPTGAYYNSGAQFNTLAYNNNGVIFSAAGPLGVDAIGVGSTSAPAQVGFYVTVDYAGGIASAGNYVFVADGTDGLVILSYTSK